MPANSSRRSRWLLVVILVTACPGPPKSQEEIQTGLDQVTTASLTRFGSAAEFDAYLGEVSALQPRGWGGLFGCAAGTSAKAAEVAPADESITNNQELGVDEGDIVKAAGDFLVVLRRGRLFTVRLFEDGTPALTPQSRIDASPPGFTNGTWYDEILVRGDRVVLVGYSYRVSATELGLFRLSPEGQLSHEGTYFLASNDYYSSRNYASRLVGDTLIFYMPFYLPVGYRSSTAPLPSLRKWTAGNTLTPWAGILQQSETYRPVQRTVHPTLHTVVQCDLSGPELSCTARGVVAPYGRSFYVSPDAVYLWVGGESQAYRDEAARQADGLVYRLPLGEGEVTAARVHGTPIDQFSFSERKDGSLYVVSAQQSGGDAMWNPELNAGDLALVKLARSDFSATPVEPAAAAWTRLPRIASSYGLQNRFVGEHLLLGTGTGWDRTTSASTLHVVPLETPGAPVPVELSHDAERLEVLGDGAAVVGTHGTDLVVSALALGDAPAVRGTFTRPNAAQGETRSHGFFFKRDEAGGGVLGLPVRLDGQPYRHLRYGSAEVAFVRVAPDLALSGLGALEASPATVDDACRVSCTDWYGNARPIFYRGRIFALLGYELLEGARGEVAVEESNRVQLLDAR